MIPLEYPLFLLLIPLGLFALAKLVRQKSGLGYSSIALIRGIGTRLPLLFLERLFLSVFLVAGTLILARPTQSVKNSTPEYQEVRDIVLVLDVSGSMGAEEKLKRAKNVLADFVSRRPQDRIALITFDTGAILEWPLSLDHDAIVYRLNRSGTGSGTQIASGIVAGLKHLRQFGQNQGALIVVSDGSSEISLEEKRVIEANLGQTRFYWIWIESVEKDELSEQFGEYVKSLGGQVFRGRITDLRKMVGQIEQLETSSVIMRLQVSTVYHFGVLPQLALASLFLAGVLNQIREV